MFVPHPSIIFFQPDSPAPGLSSRDLPSCTVSCFDNFLDGLDSATVDQVLHQDHRLLRRHLHNAENASEMLRSNMFFESLSAIPPGCPADNAVFFFHAFAQAGSQTALFATNRKKKCLENADSCILDGSLENHFKRTDHHAEWISTIRSRSRHPHRKARTRRVSMDFGERYNSRRHGTPPVTGRHTVSEAKCRPALNPVRISAESRSVSHAAGSLPFPERR